MSWFRVDDKLHSHRKTMRCSVAAIGLWVLAASWSRDQETDGWVPSYAALRLDREAEQHAAELVGAGYWHPESRGGDDGWVFHEWDEWQHSDGYLAERRRRNAERMAEKRAQEAREKGDEPAADPTPRPERAKPRKAPARPEDTPGWAEFWQTYPKRVGKAAAVKAYAKAVHAVGETDDVQSAAVILAALRAAVAGWKHAETDPQFIPHPATWLNQGRWEDEQLPGVPAPTARRATLNQCDNPHAVWPDGSDHTRHQWERGANLFHCQGVQ